ncbi:MAG: DUF5916 domain-containing protein [Longimicrobiales bacterium]
MIARLMLTALVTGSAVSGREPSPNTIYHGRENNLAVTVPRFDGAVEIDGILDEPAWRDAALLTGFSQYRPLDGVAAADSTDVLVWYSDHAIHFGVRAFEPHGDANATLADRDRIGANDHVLLLLDTFNDQRRALAFLVNPLGVQGDGVYTEGGAHDPLDLAPDFVFESTGRVTDSGYEVEIRIPFKSIRYQAAESQTWGINVVRRVQHSGQQLTWTPALQAANSFLGQSGTLESLTNLRRGLVVDVNPVVTARRNGAYDASNDWRYDGGRLQPGLNLRWGVTENLTLNATANPDFSQIEADAGQLSFDPRSSLFFSEKRPFFLEASEIFAAPNQLIYTRRVTDPIAAAKFTGKISNTDIGVLTAVDSEDGSSTGENTVYNLLRVRRDVGQASTIGLLYTDRMEGDRYNRVAAADTRLVFGGIYSVLAQAGASFTGTEFGSNGWRPVFEIGAARRGRSFGLSATLEGTHDEFRALSGFIGRTGIAHANLRPSYTVYGDPGSLVESWSSSITLDGTWIWDHFTAGAVPDDQKLHLGTSVTLRGGWHLSTAFLLESFKYPPELYARYYIDTGTDTVPYVGTDRISNYDLQINLSTPQFEKFSAGLFAIVGRDENFFEWAPAWIAIGTLNAGWRPTDRIRVDGSYVMQGYWREEDGSLVGMRQIPRIKLEYQLSRPIFLRVVGEYDVEEQDDLRDASRTGRPILFCDAGPVDCTRARGFQRGRFRADWLFSYQPTPGTVLFAGYGTTLASGDGFGFRDLRRAADGFFLKLSYLFRL